MIKRINFLASFSSPGGGEQSAFKIVNILRDNGWHVNVIPWGKVNDKFKDHISTDITFENMEEKMEPNLPLFLYCNDHIGKFCDRGEGIVKKSTKVMFAINFIVSNAPKREWLSKTGKLKYVVFQNEDKLDDWKKKEKDDLFNDLEYKIFPGAVEFDELVTIPVNKREKDEPFIIVRSSTSDSRKFVPPEKVDKGEKCYPWQKFLKKDIDSVFYDKLLDSNPNIQFEFMVAHKHLKESFKDDPRMTFREWDEIPITELFSRAHLFLYRTSNEWRDQYPRVLAEALLSGVPALVEPRDGNRDRVIHGRNGFYCIETIDYISKIKMIYENEDLRFEMCKYARKHAKKTLNPIKWVDIFEDFLNKD